MTDNNDGKLTAEAIRGRLGFSTITMLGHERFGAADVARIRAAGITRLEVCGLHPPTNYDYHDRAQVAEIIAECRKQGVAIVAVHGPNMPCDWPYDELRLAAAKESIAAARVAVEMGAGIFVGHFTTNEYAEKTVCEMLEQLDDTDIVLAIENMPGTPNLGECRDFVERIDSDRLGITLDIGHVRDPDGVNPFIKDGGAARAVTLCKGRLVHVHLHDFVDSDHYPPFDGKVRWDETFGALGDIGYAGEYMFEAIARISFADTLQKTAAFPDEFAARYLDQHPTTG